MISRDQTPSKTQEISTSSDNNNNNNAKIFNPSSSSATTTASSWSRFKDPRIIRVSKALGGKDRHSKVCTVRGLRDRRVRLSVPTAIQLYDLQERLGLNQPSKVVDWLLNAAKHEIDELPPLQIPQGMLNFGESSNLDQTMLSFQDFRGSQSDKQGLNIVRPRLNFFGDKSKDDHEISGDRDETNWVNHQGIMNSSTTSNPYNSFVRFDPSNLTLSHHPPRLSQHEDLHDFGLLPMQSTPSTHAHSESHHHHHHHHQLLVYHQPGLMSTQSYFPNSQIGVANGDFDSSTSQPIRQIHFNMTANLLPSQDNNDGSN